jgi:carbonic anhydrase/acetyltransferase-like protein (isoleucine patch superfamily)
MPIILPYEDKFPQIAEDAFIADNAVIIGDVVIGSQSSIWYNCVVRGDVNYIRIGKRTNIQDGTIIHVHRNNGPTIIGDDVTIGHKALLHACVIEDLSFIGMGAQVIDYATVKSKAMVAASALISPNKTIPSGDLWGGIPAKYMRKLTDEELDHISISAQNYVELALKYLQTKKNC